MQINEEKTLAKYGYESTDLKCSSKQPVIIICTICKKEYERRYSNHRRSTGLCNDCKHRDSDEVNFTDNYNNEYHAAPDENTTITDARNVLDELVMLCYNNNGFYPKSEFIQTNNPKLHYKCKKYFESYTEATRVADKYLEDINLNLNFVIDNVYKFNEIMRIKMQKQNAARRGWGKPMPVNTWFPNCELHHTHQNDDHQECIYIPSELHRSVWHSNRDQNTMDEINFLAFQWLATQDVI